MAQNDDIAIKVDHVHKTFKLPHEKTSSVKDLVVNFYKRKKSFEAQHVLNAISLEIKKGEFFGIVGRNGSGKSTLLKLLAGIYTPDEGSIVINGKLTPFIELGVGFSPELTGRENVFLNGALLGFNRREMDAMYEEIVAFAELERFMDQKLKNYSSGMQVRLAFSIAIRAKSDILVMDEVLAVGDAAFQQKCYDVFAELKKRGTTIVLVTHDMSAVLRFCDRAILINKGSIVAAGDPKAIADKYLELNYEKIKDSSGVLVDKEVPSVTTVEIFQGSKVIKNIETGTSVAIKIKFNNPLKQAIHFGLQIFNEAGTYCFGTNTRIQSMNPISRQEGIIEVLADLDLVPGVYSITVATMNESATTVIDFRPNARTFRIIKSVETEGVANLKHKWREESV